MSKSYETINEVVKGYFNSVLIIDDSIELEVKVEEKIKLDIGQIDMTVFDQSLAAQIEVESQIEANQEVAAGKSKVENSLLLIPRTETPQVELMEEGFVTTPYKYNSSYPVQQIDLLSNMFSNVKLLILDWDLENSKINDGSQVGEAAKYALRKYIKQEKGLKCVVIYTDADDLDAIMDELVETKLIVKISNNFFQELNEDDGHGLFGFIMSKGDVKPKQIIEEISKKLLRDKSMVLHFMSCVLTLNSNIKKAMYHFNAPFEKVIYSQIITSKIANDDIPKFLTEKFLNIVLEEPLNEKPNNFMITNKFDNLKEVGVNLGFDILLVTKIMSELNIDSKPRNKLLELFMNDNFKADLVERISGFNSYSLEDFENELYKLINIYVKDDQIKEGEKQEQEKKDLIKNLFFIMMLWDEFIEEQIPIMEQLACLDNVFKEYPFEWKNIDSITKSFPHFKIDKKIIDLLRVNNITEDLLKIINDSYDIDIFKSKIFYLLSSKQKNLNEIKFANEILNLLQLWEVYFKKQSNFSRSYSNQIYDFTRLMKFYDNSNNDLVETGSIYKIVNDDEYLLCITPYCDTFNTSKVDHLIKFLKGRLVERPSESMLKNTKDNCFVMAVPIEDDKKVNFIKWNYYEILTLKKADLLVKEEYKKMHTLRKEYIQNVINRYIAYQSRAGVDEMFYKESSYINNFKNFLQ
ncbi:hypothetical protein QJ48_02405 [Paenibacillus sp. A3]|uniref:response regulator receiver domain n=1 Tax=Paenibacillus sp. A3 TaxID=1337054 RepID=UPI0006D5B37A|nr:response regulator receiver domain [Paenibacillus sp. A3]KPV60942.1 hypothetical protein QJ48_02405 [Paenibacillus sp. A3]